MGLFSRRPRPHPLQAPSHTFLIIPDMKVLKKHYDTIEEFKQSTLGLVWTEGGRFQEPATTVVTALLGPLANSLGDEQVAEDDESIAKYIWAAAVGLAASEEEERRGWQRANEIDARVDTAIHFQPRETFYTNFVERYFVEAGYWYARTGDEGLRKLVAPGG